MKTPEILPMTPPKFIRDAMEINDISGCRPKKIGNEKNLFKEPIIKDVIKDSWPKKPYLRKSKYEYLDYRDVTNQTINHRNTNPLRPIYNWSYVDDKKCFGPIDGNSPLVYSKYLYKNPLNLTNKDIEGTNTNSKNRYMKFHGTNYSYNTRDIKGAQGDTIARGIITNRHINPIVPKYKYLGHSEIPNIDNNPYFKGFQSPGHYNKKNNYRKINFVRNNNTFDNFNIITNKNTNTNSIDNTNEAILNNNDNKSSLNNNANNNENNKLIEKNIKIIDNKNVEKEKNEKKGEYKDFGNLPVFNDKVDFDKNNYIKSNGFSGFSQYPNLLPSNKGINQINQKKFEKLKIPLRPLNNKENKSRSVSTFFKEENTYYTKLDNFINSRNLKNIENQTLNQNQKENEIINNENNDSNHIENKNNGVLNNNTEKI